MYEKFIKRIIDIVLALTLLVIILPLFVFVSLAIWVEDHGNPFFVQSRLGFRGRPFKLWKFRSMISGADKFLDDEGRPTRNRVTRVGAFLRRSSIDELPQVINVLRGDMSFIGPRPALLSQYSRYTDEQRERLSVKPGITGLAQISGRNTLQWSKRISLDIEYARNVSFCLDVSIFINTVVQVFRTDGVVIDRNADDVDDLGPVRDDVNLPYNFED